MVITRSHINEQISKGGKKMAKLTEAEKLKSLQKKGTKLKFATSAGNLVKDTKTKSGWGTLATKEYKKQQQRKARDEISRLRKSGFKSSALGWEVKPPKKTKKKVVVTPKIKKKPEVKQKPLPEIKAKKKKKTKSGPHMLFGGQKVRIPGKKGGGVITQKVKKYNLGGIVVHDSTKSTKV
jgi:hypothetical protein